VNGGKAASRRGDHVDSSRLPGKPDDGSKRPTPTELVAMVAAVAGAVTAILTLVEKLVS
jgi:hypothetical protein